MVQRIAMWSGPRNLSTALMYSFGARADCAVVDEPFYGAYLSLTGADHPMADAVKASMDCDPGAVAAALVGPCDRPVFYQKHMTHHMVEGVPRDWFGEVRHAFLIRHPARVLASYAAKRAAPTLEDIGFAQQWEIYQATGGVVVDASDIRAAPERILPLLCEALEIAWDPAMLRWPAGGRPEDGVWAAHWYGGVHRSTGFVPDDAELPELPKALAAVAAEAMPIYEALAAQRLRVN
ncbi:MAG: HAD family hydrolase [Pseudomonadota bacterium]